METLHQFAQITTYVLLGFMAGTMVLTLIGMAWNTAQKRGW